MLGVPGMASKLINFWRLSKEDLKAEERLTASSGAAGGVSTSSTQPQRISREVLALNGKRVDLERNHAGVPEFPRGQTLVLDPEDSSPFLGQIEDRMLQQALFTNMFKAPLFEHAARPTDFLLIRAPSNRVRDPPVGEEAGQNECYAVREIPRIYLSGQVEPNLEVRAIILMFACVGSMEDRGRPSSCAASRP